MHSTINTKQGTFDGISFNSLAGDRYTCKRRLQGGSGGVVYFGKFQSQDVAMKILKILKMKLPSRKKIRASTKVKVEEDDEDDMNSSCSWWRAQDGELIALDLITCRALDLKTCVDVFGLKPHANEKIPDSYKNWLTQRNEK